MEMALLSACVLSICERGIELLGERFVSSRYSKEMRKDRRFGAVSANFMWESKMH